MRSALEALEAIQRRIESGEHPLLFLDFDGTLAPIVLNPRDAAMSDRTRDVVRKNAVRYSTYIVSGRSLQDIRERASVEGVNYAGNHGMEWVVNGVEDSRLSSADAQRDMTEIESVLRSFAATPGVLVEDKGISVAFHYRAVAERDRDSLVAEARSLVAPIIRRGRLEILEQKKLLDIRPRGWHKGDFVLAELGRAGANAFGIYIGDDRTDEDAFSAITDGFTVFVGNDATTSARYGLKDIEAVNDFLQRLSELH